MSNIWDIHIFDKNGVQPNQDKVRAILDAPAPADLKQVQAFVGLCNFYNRFITNFSSCSFVQST